MVGQRIERGPSGLPVPAPLRRSAARGRRTAATIVDLHRLGKRIVFELDDELFLVFHLMIAGRFRWKEPGAKLPGKVGLLALDFARGTLILTEAGTKRRASLHVVQGRAALAEHDPGGLEVLRPRPAAFAPRCGARITRSSGR